MIAHWDEVEGYRREKGPMAATWQALGNAAGAKGIGLNRIRIEPGRLSTPPHSHNRAEEIFFVLGGSGLLWQDEAVCEVGAGDTIVQLADSSEHTFRAGPKGWTCSLSARAIGRSTAGCRARRRCASATCGRRAALTIRGTWRPRSAS